MNRRGSVSIEALLSIMLLMIVISVTWGLCVFIFNASMVSSATQMGAQAGLLAFDRGSYRGMTNPEFEASQTRGRTVAGHIFRENTCGMLADQFTGGRPDYGCGETGFAVDYGTTTGVNDFRFQIYYTCGSLETNPLYYSRDNCKRISGSSAANASAAVRARAVSDSAMEIPFSSLASDGTRTNSGKTFNTEASAYSFVWEEP